MRAGENGQDFGHGTRPLAGKSNPIGQRASANRWGGPNNLSYMGRPPHQDSNNAPLLRTTGPILGSDSLWLQAACIPLILGIVPAEYSIIQIVIKTWSGLSLHWRSIRRAYECRDDSNALTSWGKAQA